MPNGEAFMEFYDRVTRGLEQIIKENKSKHVLIVSHNGALSATHCHLTGAGPKALLAVQFQAGTLQCGLGFGRKADV